MHLGMKHALQACRVECCVDHRYLQLWEKEVSLFSILRQADEIRQVRDCGMAPAMMLVILTPPMPRLHDTEIGSSPALALLLTSHSVLW